MLQHLAFVMQLPRLHPQSTPAALALGNWHDCVARACQLPLHQALVMYWHDCIARAYQLHQNLVLAMQSRRLHRNSFPTAILQLESRSCDYALRGVVEIIKRPCIGEVSPVVKISKSEPQIHFQHVHGLIPVKKVLAGVYYRRGSKLSMAYANLRKL